MEKERRKEKNPDSFEIFKITESGLSDESDQEIIQKETENIDDTKVSKLSYHIKEIIKIIGDDPNREGLKKTPTRYAKALLEILSGYSSDPYKEINGAVFNLDYKGLVVVSNIKFFSLCEHHMLPFFGTASIAYLPKNKIIGLSKIPRITKVFASKLQVQERLTEEIGKFVEKVVGSEGVAVYISAYHLCLAMRGARKEDVVMETLFFSGKFKSDWELKKIFLEKIKKSEIDK
ncbi:MAG: GTP cyclohydrolase I FolE [Candidatus Calescibacterium sp.]|nr:GTP cyclohydrolase I FolE [Candidatus Calescibacterium sp.]MCX7733440.1 GTP cyclohydrolase I FolE [bacterium]MDW8087533.1 GTP cyclohydrolase I FolE [Candidatus Calescibacterium sp.]